MLYTNYDCSIPEMQNSRTALKWYLLKKQIILSRFRCLTVQNNSRDNTSLWLKFNELRFMRLKYSKQRSLAAMSALIFFVRNAVTYPFAFIRKGSRTHATSTHVADGRLYALDLARFVAMVFMMQGHVLDAVVSRNDLVITEFPWNVWHLIRGFTAPVFLMVSGAVHAFATKRSESGQVREDVLAKRIRWAFTIIGIGYLLTFPASRVWDLPFVPETNWQSFLAVNILQLTGATMLLFVMVVASTKNVAQMGRRGLVTALAILTVTPLMQHAASLAVLPFWVRAFLDSNTGSIFPVFPFSAYLFVGLFIGSLLHAIPKEQRDAALLHNSWRYGIVVCAVGLVTQFIMLQLGTPLQELEGPMSIPLFVSRVGIVLMVFSGAVWILNHTWRYRNWYSLFGTKSLWIYIIHLIILFGTPWSSSIGRTHFHKLSVETGVLLAVAIIATTLLCALAFDWYAKQPWALRWKKPLLIVGYGAIVLALLV